MLTAGVIVGAGPLRVLINGGWDAPVFVGGRWGGTWSPCETLHGCCGRSAPP